MTKIICILLLFTFSTSAVQAQFLRKLQQKVQSDIIDKVADKISDRLAEDIAKKAYKPLDEAFEEAYNESVSDSTNQEGKADYSGFLKSFNTAAEKLPAEYNFDVVNHMEIEDTDGKVNNMKMMFPLKGEYFGMETEDDGKNTLLVYDLKNEIIAMYSEDKGVKKVNVMPSMLDLAGAYVKSNATSEEYKIEKTGKTKNILGFSCEEYKVESEKYITYSFVTNDFPVSWQETYGNFIKKFAPATTNDLEDLENAMSLYSETTYKENEKKKSFLEVVKVDQSGFKINNGDYEKIKMGQD